MLRTYDVHNPLLTSCDTLMGSLEAAEEAGIDISEALKSNGIAPDLLVSPKGFLTFHQAVNFLNEVANNCDCPHFGFLVGKHQPALQFGSLAQLSKLSANLLSAIEIGNQYSLLNSEVSLWDLKQENGYAMLLRHSRVAYEGSLIQFHTLAVTLIFNALKNLIGGNWRASSIAFTHAQPKSRKLLDQYFGSPVDFNQDFNGVVFPEEHLQYEIKTADEELLAIVKSHLDSVSGGSHQLDADIATNVHHHIIRHLGTNLCNLESVARLLGHSPRMLQLELQKQNITFRQLLGDVRQEVAEHYLRSSTIVFSDLADILGYRNVSAFSRAFKKASGTSPEKWKRLLQEDN